VKAKLEPKYEKSFSSSCPDAYWNLTIEHEGNCAVRNDTRNVSDSSEKKVSTASLSSSSWLSLMQFVSERLHFTPTPPLNSRF
jgi:hypothetical protein